MLRLRVIVWPLLALGFNLGCVHPILKPREGLTTMKQATSTVPTRGDTQVAIASRLLDQPAGSDYLTRGVWRDATTPLTHELTTLLAINGLRLGVIGATRPQEFQTLMSSEASVVNAMIRTTSVGRPRVVPVNGPLPQCELEYTPSFEQPAERREYASAECGVQVVATPGPNGGMKLKCELQIQHGDRQPFLQPSADGSNLTRQDQRPTDSFTTIAWELTLDRDEALIVGPTEEPVGKLGQAYFFAGNDERPRQRLLVIQAGVTSESAEAVANPKASRSPAARAGNLVVRKD
jgi:hypothetical protein